MISYTLHLSCDKQGCIDYEHGRFPYTDQFYGESQSDCIEQAKADGWKFFSRRQEVHCPNCNPECY